MAWKRTLHVTSPLMRGPDVKEAQKILTKNRFGKFQPGKVDGIWGESSMRATKRAKFWLGYSKSTINGKYGEQLDKYLRGMKLKPEMLKRRTQRLKAGQGTTIGEKALKRAATQIGYKETPVNRTKFGGGWYGFDGPWCAMFVSWCYVNSGSKSFKRGVRASYVPWLITAARHGNYGFSRTNTPKPGDLVCFDWGGDGTYDHVGLYEKNLGGGNFQTIEGNTSNANDSNGGEVMRRRRSTSFGHPYFIRAH